MKNFSVVRQQNVFKFNDVQITDNENKYYCVCLSPQACTFTTL